jgi:metal-dependent amidase/aminoacylase/carboxypeptidase family protein
MHTHIKELARQAQPELIELRRELHRHPELAWHETATTDKIAALLERWKFVIVKRGFNGTRSGIVADLAGEGGAGRTFALRADIDALPLTEETGAPYSSEVPGVSHA